MDWELWLSFILSLVGRVWSWLLRISGFGREVDRSVRESG